MEGFLNFVAFNGTIWIPMFLMTVVTAAGVQLFYAWRIAVLSQRRVFAFIALGVSIGVALTTSTIEPPLLTAAMSQSAAIAFCFGLIGSLEMKVRAVTWYSIPTWLKVNIV